MRPAGRVLHGALYSAPAASPPHATQGCGVPPAAQQKVMGHMVKSTQVMGAMNRLVKIGDISQTMQAMQKEMCKVCAMPGANPNLKRRPLCRGAEPSRARRPHTACLTRPASSPALRPA